MNFRQRQKDLRVEISMINLIDVMFCVVIFLLLTMTFKQAGAGLGIKLPKSRSMVEKRAEALVVQVTPDGEAYFNGGKVAVEDLEGRLRAGLEGRGDKTVTVQGDEKAPHGKMVAVYDAIRKAGATAISVAAVSPGTPNP